MQPLTGLPLRQTERRGSEGPVERWRGARLRKVRVVQEVARICVSNRRPDCTSATIFPCRDQTVEQYGEPLALWGTMVRVCNCESRIGILRILRKHGQDAVLEI